MQRFGSVSSVSEGLQRRQRLLQFVCHRRDHLPQFVRARRAAQLVAQVVDALVRPDPLVKLNRLLERLHPQLVFQHPGALAILLKRAIAIAGLSPKQHHRPMGRLVQPIQSQPASGVGQRFGGRSLRGQNAHQALKRIAQLAPKLFGLGELPVVKGRAVAQAEAELWLSGFDALLTPSAPDEAPEGYASTGTSTFNRAWTLLEGNDLRRVLLVSEGNLFLERLFAVLPGYEVFRAAPDEVCLLYTSPSPRD